MLDYDWKQAGTELCNFSQGTIMAMASYVFAEAWVGMNTKLRELPIEERIRLVEDLWDSIASDQQALPLTSDQISELDLRLDRYEADGDLGRPMTEVVAEIRKRL